MIFVHVVAYNNNWLIMGASHTGPPPKGPQFSRKWVLGGAVGAGKLKLWYCTKSINVNAIFSVQRVYVLQLGARKRCVFSFLLYLQSLHWKLFFRDLEFFSWNLTENIRCLKVGWIKCQIVFVWVVHTSAVQQFYFDFLYFSRYVFSYEVKGWKYDKLQERYIIWG